MEKAGTLNLAHIVKKSAILVAFVLLREINKTFYHAEV